MTLREAASLSHTDNSDRSADERLPKDVFESLQRTIKDGSQLDESIADAVAIANAAARSIARPRSAADEFEHRAEAGQRTTHPGAT